MTVPVTKLETRSGLAPQSGSERASVRDHMKRVATARPFAAFMTVVAVLAGVYYGLIATPLYVSQASFAVRSKTVEAPTGLLPSLLGQQSGALADVTAVTSYISSQDMLQQLQKRVDLRSIYTQSRIDPFQSLPKNASREAFLNFYRRHVLVRVDREAATVTVVVQSFDAKSAQDVANAVLELTEQFVNGMSQRLRDDSLASAQAHLQEAQRNAESARRAVTEFRGRHSDIDPAASGEALVGALSSLQQQKVGLEGQLASLSTYNKPNAPAVEQMRAQISSLNAQIAATRGHQTAESNRPQQVTSFETLQLNRTSAEKALDSATTSLQIAQSVAEQREKFVVRIVSPSLAQEATMPNRMLEFLTILVFGVAGYALVALTVAAIRDHRGI